MRWCLLQVIVYHCQPFKLNNPLRHVCSMHVLPCITVHRYTKLHEECWVKRKMCVCTMQCAVCNVHTTNNVIYYYYFMQKEYELYSCSGECERWWQLQHEHMSSVIICSAQFFHAVKIFAQNIREMAKQTFIIIILYSCSMLLFGLCAAYYTE